jgi:hypothetical protein
MIDCWGRVIPRTVWHAYHHTLLLFDIEQQSFLNENALISVMSYLHEPYNLGLSEWMII